MRHHGWLACAAVLLLAASEGRTCGPNFPARLLLQPSANATKVPTAWFAKELQRIVEVPAAPTPTDQDSAEFDDLRDAGLLRGWPDMPGWRVRMSLTRVTGDPTWVRDVPEEMWRYLVGAHHFHAGDLPSARREWLALLDLPPGQRKARSVWAAYMLGRLAVASDPREAERRFEQTRALAKQGFSDRAGLTLESLGSQARLLGQGTPAERVRAIHLYLQQVQAGMYWADENLRLRLPELLAAPGTLEAAAADPQARRVVTAWILAMVPSGAPEVTHWLEVLEAKAPKFADASRIAWLECRAGRFDRCKRWLGRAADGDAVTDWLRAKVALHDGDLAAAAKWLASARRGFPEQEAWPGYSEDREARPAHQLDGELALVALPRREFVEAFDHLMRGGYWTDAAWVAERVLTVAELRQWLKTHPDPPPKVVKPATDGDQENTYSNYWLGTPPEPRQVRELLGRRLMRAGQYAEALALLPADVTPLASQVAQFQRLAADASKAEDVRAVASFQAAVLIRKHGMELMGTEVEPDWTIWSGDFQDEPTLKARRLDQGPVAPKPEELQRIARAGVANEARFHYRAVAQAMVLQASRRLPATDPRGAAMLCHAGAWFHDRNPELSRPVVHECKTRFKGFRACYTWDCPEVK